MIRITDAEGREVVNPVVSGTSEDFSKLCDSFRRLTLDRRTDYITLFSEEEQSRFVRLERTLTEHDDVMQMFSAAEIAARVKTIADALNKDYVNRSFVMLIVADGGMRFGQALMNSGLRRMEAMDVIKVQSYEGTAPGQVEIVADVNISLEGRHVVVVDDIIDTGHTLAKVVERVLRKGAASVEVCVLLDKPSGRKNPTVRPRFIGFTLAHDDFVVGYGLDYNGKYRNLPYIGVLRAEAIEK